MSENRNINALVKKATTLFVIMHMYGVEYSPHPPKKKAKHIINWSLSNQRP